MKFPLLVFKDENFGNHGFIGNLILRIYRIYRRNIGGYFGKKFRRNIGGYFGKKFRYAKM